MGLMNNYRSLAQKYKKTHSIDVASLDYRYYPNNVFPAALDDAVEGYQQLLLQYQPQNILVIGDSAGGNQALTLCLKLRDLQIALPRALVLLSPYGDISHQNTTYVTKGQLDPLLGYKVGEQFLNGGNPYLGEADPNNPLISPIHGNFQGFPDTLIQVGTLEVVESDSDVINQKMVEAGVNCKLTKYTGMFHVFQILFPGLKESKAAWAEINSFIADRK